MTTGFSIKWLFWTSLGALPAVQETLVESLVWEDPLEKETANHWKIPRTEEPVGSSPWGRRVAHD